MHTALGYVFTIEWAVYVGGALFMELVWRPLQRHVPPGQTGVLCNAMGRRYRWLAIASLVAIAATCGAWQVTGGPGELSPARWLALGAAWVVLASLVTVMGLLVHPRSHARLEQGEDRAELKRRRMRSIRVMDVLLRIELGVALVGALVAAWPHGSGPGPSL